MIKILLAFLCFFFLIYFATWYFTNSEAIKIDLSEGDYIDNSINLDTIKPDSGNNAYTYSLWLYITKPPPYESNIFSHSIDNDGNTSVVLSAENNTNTLKLNLDNSMPIDLHNYLNQRWNHITITYFSGKIKVYINTVLEKTLDTPVQNIYIETLATAPIIIGNYDGLSNTRSWQPRNAYISYFTYEPNTVYDQDKINSIYKQQSKTLIKTDDELNFKINLLKNGVPFN